MMIAAIPAVRVTAYALIGISLLFICISDINKLIIPDEWVAVIFAAGLAFNTQTEARLAGLAGPLLLYLAMALACAALKKSPPIGMGDAKLLAAIGFAGGPAAPFFCFCIASIVCGPFAFAVLLINRKRKIKKDRIAFGPFIAFAFILYLLSVSAM